MYTIYDGINMKNSSPELSDNAFGCSNSNRHHLSVYQSDDTWKIIFTKKSKLLV